MPDNRQICGKCGSIYGEEWAKECDCLKGGATMTDTEEGETKNDIAFQRGYSAGVKAKFGKDNNGMVASEHQVEQMLNDFHTCIHACENRIEERKVVKQWRDNFIRTFSQQPPKEQADTCNCHIDDDDGNINYCEKHEPKEPVHDCGCGMGESCHALKKERKVSLLEINGVIKNSDLLSLARSYIELNRPKYRYGTSDDMSLELAQSILSLLNATEERKGEE
jgi:hypothetical protein